MTVDGMPFPWLQIRTNGCGASRPTMYTCLFCSRHLACMIRQIQYMVARINLEPSVQTRHVCVSAKLLAIRNASPCLKPAFHAREGAGVTASLGMPGKCMATVCSLYYCRPAENVRLNDVQQLYPTNSAPSALRAIPLPLGGLGFLLPLALAMIVAAGLLSHNFLICAAGGAIQAPSSFIIPNSSARKQLATLHALEEAAPGPVALLLNAALACSAQEGIGRHGSHARLKGILQLGFGAAATLHLCPVGLHALQAQPGSLGVFGLQLCTRESLCYFHHLAAEAFILLQAIAIQLAATRVGNPQLTGFTQASSIGPDKVPLLGVKAIHR